MKQVLILFTTLMLSVGLWAIDGVKYLDAAGVEQTANDVTEITNASTILTGGWYVVYGENVQTGTLVCEDAVHIILADGAKLTATGNNDIMEDNATPGIQVSGTSNSLILLPNQQKLILKTLRLCKQLLPLRQPLWRRLGRYFLTMPARRLSQLLKQRPLMLRVP